MSLPTPLISAVSATLGQVVEEVPVGGGDISQAARLRLKDGRQLLLKWRREAPPGFFAAERQGLELLRLAKTLRVPEVLAQQEAAADCPPFIALEWLEPGSKSARSAEALGLGLAGQHRILASAYGLAHDNFIGTNPQANRQNQHWVDFFREQRLGFQIELAGRNNLLPAGRAGRLERLLARLDEWLPAQPPASLLHGDLWGGNWLATGSGEPALIDPAVYYGHRETDLAFTELFGGFPATFYAAYHSAWPLEPGYETRQPLYNLYHLLNHLNLFGESYGSGIDAVLSRFLRT